VERYDGKFDDIFEFQDRIASSVAGAIVPSLQRAEVERAQRKPPENLKAYDLYLRALPHLHAMTLDENSEAIRLLKQAIAVEPAFALAASFLSFALTFRVVFGWSAHADLEAEAVHFARLALSLNKEDSEILARYAVAIAFFLGQHQEAVGFARRAVDLNPNSSVAWRESGYVHLWGQQAATAVEHFGQALRLSPRDPLDFHVLTGQTSALLAIDSIDEAIEAARRAVQRGPHYVLAWRALSASLAVAGRMTEARAALAEHQRLAPGTTLAKIRSGHQATMRPTSRLLDGLRQAGMPEG
jgi:adenylate cyclase